MSLDVNLFYPATTEPAEDGEEYPYFSANVSHNLGIMAGMAGIYYAVWRPEEIGAFNAHQIIPLLEEGLAKLKRDPDKYTAFETKSGWGTYKDFVPWLEKYLAACKECPAAIILTSR